jgi:hypothetical protein
MKFYKDPKDFRIALLSVHITIGNPSQTNGWYLHTCIKGHLTQPTSHYLGMISWYNPRHCHIAHIVYAYGYGSLFSFCPYPLKLLNGKRRCYMTNIQWNDAHTGHVSRLTNKKKRSALRTWHVAYTYVTSALILFMCSLLVVLFCGVTYHLRWTSWYLLGIWSRYCVA